jgi:hypothetical protein
MATALRRELGVVLPPPEIAAITESLLAFPELVDRVIEEAPARNLTEHVPRLQLRLR